MANIERWIWLPKDQYPLHQTTTFAAQRDPENGHYTVAEFRKDFQFDCEVVEAQLRFSGDTSYRLYLNDEILATGPISVGGDFLYNDQPRSRHYASEITVCPNACELRFFACVTMMPVAINEYSRGHGGFMLEGKLRMANGQTRYITTDGTWLARHNRAFVRDCHYDQTLDTDVFSPAEEIANIWHCQTAPIKPRTEEILLPDGEGIYPIAPGEAREIIVEFDRIYAGFVAVEVRTEGALTVEVDCVETDAVGAHYELNFIRDDAFRGLQLQSIGLYRIKATNRSGQCH